MVVLPPMAGERRTAAATLALGHGRMAQRWLQTRAVAAGDSDWPGLAHVVHRESQVIRKKTEAVRAAVVAGGPSLAPERADAARWRTLIRGQWQIANRSHGVRDVTFAEDRSQVRRGPIPQAMAARRHTVLGRRRWVGYPNMAAACRRFAALPTAALHLIAIVRENCMALPCESLVWYGKA